MSQAFRTWPFYVRALLMAIALGIAMGLADPAGAADIEEAPAADVRSAQRAIRSCTDDCASECRAARATCVNDGDNEDSCRAQFQICVRRCIVSCGAQ